MTILLFTTLNEKAFVPLAQKLTNNVQGITSLQRIGIGLVFSIAAIVGAAVVKKQRREIDLEFFIKEAPDRMKSMNTWLFLSTVSMGFFMSSLLVSIIDHVMKKSWLRSNLNKGKLNNFY
ncbi:hypothetical protein F3Y22_tig00001732pilonHSYRG00022 [Hibiscus syriacus]|uniref:Uncharacterized protein n=1 Tax=Hibiscus syriacus TaxID=106335 RepID=A0A6A3CWH3_HIBSY|nr:hypothetical protein F3Y22_tig00001732pilonHSYRG00022 [Hibiscus syriacus]